MSEKNEEITVENVSIDQLPTLIKDQFSQLQAVKTNVEKAAKKAKEAQDFAMAARQKPADLFHRKEAVEDLQEATFNITEAQVASAEAQEVSFEYQQKLGEITKFLFGLGVSNIAANRSVVRELEIRLRDASEEELDELARQEIISVVRQLKAQEDIMQKQSQMSAVVKEHDDFIEEQKKKNKKHDCMIKEQSKRDAEQDEEIIRQAENDLEHDKRLDEGEEKDKAQDEVISRQTTRIEQLEKRCSELEEKARTLGDITNEMNEDFRTVLNTKYNKIWGFVSLGIATTALILSILGLFL